jgi:hypothetical protein
MVLRMVPGTFRTGTPRSIGRWHAVDAAFDDRQNGDDHDDRAGDQQQLIPSALVGEQRARRRETGHVASIVRVVLIE